MPRTDLFIEISSRESVTSLTNLAPSPLPGFYQGATLDLRIYLIKARTDGADPDRITTTGRDLYVSVGEKVGNTDTEYTSQSVWTPNPDLTDPYWEAQLPLNTAAITSLLGTRDKRPAYFEILLYDSGNPNPVLSKSVSVEATVHKGSTVVPAGQTPLSAEVAASTYVPQAGFQGKLLLISADGTKQGFVYWGDDNTLHGDPA